MLTSIVITKNEEQMINDCLMSLKFSDQIIVVDTGNSDNTNQIAKRHHAEIVKSQGNDYSKYRNDGLTAAQGDWILYVDADERVTPLLRHEIESVAKREDSKSAYAIGRQTIILGKLMHHGGWGTDLNSVHNSYAIRLFKRKNLKGYQRALHEQPTFSGELGYLQNFLVHITHRDLASMINKTLTYSDQEAQLKMAANHPPIVWWRFVSVMAREFWLRFVVLAAYKDGTEGIIEGLYQVFNQFIIYTRLWELQNKNDI